jgi:hypothetical protein
MVSRKPYNLTIDTEKFKEEILNKTKATDCNVVDMGNKLYIYLEFNGVDLSLSNINLNTNTNLNGINIYPQNINNQKDINTKLHLDVKDKIKNSEDYYRQQLEKVTSEIFG